MNKNQIIELGYKANQLFHQAMECLRDKQVVEAQSRLSRAMKIKTALTKALDLNSGWQREVIRDVLGSIEF